MSTTIDLPVVIDRAVTEPLTGQLARQLRAAMRDGRMRAGERLPSSRALASTVGVSRTVVTEAYQQLYAEGWLEGRHGSGTFVADVAFPLAAPLRSPTSPLPSPTSPHSSATSSLPLATSSLPTAASATPHPPSATPHLSSRDHAARVDTSCMITGGVGAGTDGADVVLGDGGGPVDLGRAVESRPGSVRAAVIELRPGVPWVAGLDTPAWRRAWRLAATAPLAGRSNPWGMPELRAALAEHLRRSRGVACRPDEMLITRGATNGLDMLAATTLRPGDRVGIEEPGYPAARTVLAARGAVPVPCPVDEHGLIVDALPDDLRILYTTPSHQYPLGGRLSVPRRQALIEWARHTGAILAEDDYDGEFRYDVAPLPALYGLAPDVTVYLGTTAKMLAPEVGVGWLVADPDLAERIAARREALRDRTAIVPQEALRVLLQRGDLDRHIRRMRAEYGRRRAAVVTALGDLRLRGETAGLHVFVELPADVADQVVAAAARQGVLLTTIDGYYSTSPETPADPTRLSGLVIGYGGATTEKVRSGCSLVRQLVLTAQTTALR